MDDKIQELFNSQLVVVNLGARIFGAVAEKQGAETIQVNWSPDPDEEMQDILKLLGGF